MKFAITVYNPDLPPFEPLGIASPFFDGEHPLADTAPIEDGGHFQIILQIVRTMELSVQTISLAMHQLCASRTIV